MPQLATVPLPDARRRLARRVPHAAEEVRALLRLIQRGAAGPDQQTPTREQIAALVGVTASTLNTYCSVPRQRGRDPRGVPYAVLYCLEVLAANPVATAQALWS